MESNPSERMVFALRQAAVVAIVLVVAGSIVDRLRPGELTDRGFVSTPFWWAAVLWCIVLVADAVLFDRSRLRDLERLPLALAVGVAIATLATGVASISEGSVGRRLVYLAANAAGALAFWWALFSLLWLAAATITIRNRPSTP